MTDQELESSLERDLVRTTPQLDARILAAGERSLENCTFRTASDLDARILEAASIQSPAVGTMHTPYGLSNGPVATGRAPTSPPRPVRRVGTLTLAGTAALLTGALGLWLARPVDSWAQVADAVRSKAWVRLTLKGPEVVEVWM